MAGRWRKSWYQSGVEIGEKIWGKEFFAERLKKAQRTHPFFDDLSVLGWSLFARPGLDLKTRELCQIACLTTSRILGLPFRLHVIGALNCGATPTEIEEVIIQLTTYAGIAPVRAAMDEAKEIIATYKRPGDLTPKGRAGKRTQD
jgi:alkylhydroperoxidase/carboxymuconolactone decarboxylase family protein YurZ